MLLFHTPNYNLLDHIYSIIINAYDYLIMNKSYLYVGALKPCLLEDKNHEK